MRKRLLILVVLVTGCGAPTPVAIPEATVLKKLTSGVHKETAEGIKYTISIPEGYDGKTAVPLVLALHYGYDGAAPSPYTGGEMIKAFDSGLANLNAIIVAPDVLGGDWKDAKNEKGAVWLTKSVMKTYNIDPKKVLITGFSLGGEGTWYIGSRHQDLFTGAIPVAAPVAGSTQWKIPVYVIHSDKDTVVSYAAAKKHADAIKAKGAKLDFASASGLQHYDTTAYASHVGAGVRWIKSQWQ